MFVVGSPPSFSPGPIPREEAEEDDDDVIEGSPPSVSISIPSHFLSTQGQKRTDDFPSSGLAQDSASTVQLQGFTPTSTASTTMPTVSEVSYDIGVDIDMEQELQKLGYGSDVDVDVDADVDAINDGILRQRDVFEFPAELEDFEDPAVVQAVLDIDAGADASLREMTEDDLLHFDWRGDADTFRGPREIFTGPSGPTFDVSGMTPLGVF